MTERRFPNKWFWVTLLIPVIILAIMMMKPLTTLAFGQTIWLKIISFQESNSMFKYKIIEVEKVEVSKVNQEILKRRIPTTEEMTEAVPVYVLLKPQGNQYVIHKVEQKKPRSGVYLSGKLLITLKTLRSGILHIEYPWKNQIEHNDYQKNQLIQLKVRNGYAIINDFK